MEASLGTADLAVLALYVLGVVAIGLVFMRQHDVREFCLGNQELRAWQIGLSLTATLITATNFADVAGEAYERGVQAVFVMPIALLIVCPLAAWVASNYRRQNVLTIFEIQGQYFGRRIQTLSGVWFVISRFLWLVVVLLGCGQVMQVAAGIDGSEWTMILVVGLLATLYTFLGGLRAVVWTDLLQLLTIALGVIVLFVVAILHVKGGANVSLEGIRQFPGPFRHDESPFLVVYQIVGTVFLLLSFYATDQVAGQRFLAAASVRDARNATFIHAALAAGLFLLVGCTGLALFGFYQKEPRANELVQVAAARQNAQPLKVSTSHDVTKRERHMSPVSGDKQTVDRFDSRQSLLPYFVAHHLPWGLKGLVLAAIMAAAMSTLDAGLSALATVTFVELRQWRGTVAADPEDELPRVQTLVILVGMLAIFASLMFIRLPAGLRLLQVIATVSGAPLVSLWILGSLANVRQSRTAWVTFGATVFAGAACLLMNWETLGEEFVYWPLGTHYSWLAPATVLFGLSAGMAGQALFPRTRKSGAPQTISHECPMAAAANTSEVEQT